MPNLEPLTTASFFEDLIVRFINSNTSNSPDRIFVSELACCLRASYFRRVKPVKYLGSRAIRLFIGLAIHELLEKLLPNSLHGSSAEVRRELKIVVDGDEVIVCGRADLIALNSDEFIIEVKVVNKLPNEPLPEHRKQLLYYLAMFGIDRGILLYISRGGRLRTFTISRDPSVMAEIVERAKLLYLALKYRKTPRPEKSPHCYFCNYKWLCLSER